MLLVGLSAIEALTLTHSHSQGYSYSYSHALLPCDQQWSAPFIDSDKYNKAEWNKSEKKREKRREKDKNDKWKQSEKQREENFCPYFTRS